MSAAGRVNQKRLPPHKNNGINSLDRNEAESSHHGRSLSQYAYVADQTPERRQQRNDSSRHASVRFKLPAQATNSRVLSATTSRQIPPLSDAGGDFERVQPESSGNSSSSHLSRNPIQHEEIKRLQMEIAALKEQKERLLLAESMGAGQIKELKRKLDENTSSSKALETEINKTKALFDRLKEHLQCQICLETLNSPWTLAPCGHVGCLECLLNWFTVGQDEEDSTDPILRDKTCPQCRTLILVQPTPSYILKSIIEEMQSIGMIPRSSSAPVANSVDPWSKIFPLTDDLQGDDEEEETYSGDDSYGENDSDAESSDSPSESSEYRGEFQARMENLDQMMTWELEMRNEATSWTIPTWQPPRFDSSVVDISPADVSRLSLPASEISSLLRRGATQEMIRLFHLSYDHQRGIVVPHTDTISIRLGWNISRSSSDPDGRIYIRAVLDELNYHPERFRLEHTYSYEFSIIRMVPSPGDPDDSENRDD